MDWVQNSRCCICPKESQQALVNCLIRPAPNLAPEILNPGVCLLEVKMCEIDNSCQRSVWMSGCLLLVPCEAPNLDPCRPGSRIDSHLIAWTMEGGGCFGSIFAADLGYALCFLFIYPLSTFFLLLCGVCHKEYGPGVRVTPLVSFSGVFGWKPLVLVGWETTKPCMGWTSGGGTVERGSDIWHLKLPDGCGSKPMGSHFGW